MRSVGHCCVLWLTLRVFRGQNKNNPQPLIILNVQYPDLVPKTTDVTLNRNSYLTQMCSGKKQKLNKSLLCRGEEGRVMTV